MAFEAVARHLSFTRIAKFRAQFSNVDIRLVASAKVGELVRPFDAALPSKFSFYLLHSSSQPLRPHGAQFRAWLLSEAGSP
ncbi:MAG: hypothetical protein O7A03_11400 [Alphaproteobacteria bacterium]|nr:hypothetical protein [Alphaproteobacteria bacterium]